MIIINRVKFYSNTDMSCGYNFNMAVEFIKKLDAKKTDYEINDILEMFNILKFFQEDILKQIEKETSDLCRNSEKTIYKIIGKFCNTIRNDNIESIILGVDNNYIEDFFELMNKYKIYEKISNAVFVKILSSKKYYLDCILTNENLVYYYDEEIRNALLMTDDSAELLLNNYEVEHIGHINKKYFPKSLTIKDKERIFINYVKSESCNLNYLRIIVNFQSTSELEISDKTKLLAKRKVEEQQKKFFNKNSGITMETSIRFSYDIDKAYDLKIDGQNWEFTYNLKWIKENNDNSTLLNNFIYLFEYVDKQMRWTMVSKFSHMGIFERSIITRSKRDYPTSTAFNRINQLSDLQLMGYYKELQKMDIRLEDIIIWFFQEYLVNEFKIKNYNISMPSKDSNYLEKCRTLLPEIDSCLKQYNYYVEDGIIDSELLEISSKHLLFKDVKSLLNNKYVYPIEGEFDIITYYFFSDQCMLSYVENKKQKYNNFYELVLKENITREEIVQFEQKSLDKLIDDGYLIIDYNNYIRFRNRRQILILKDMYENEVISYWKLSENERKEVNNLVIKGLLKFDNSLFSKPEQDYLNYYLNKSDFINSLDLRNMYSHGTQPFGDENIHYQNYIIFLRIFISIIIKINDELCIKDDIAKGVINE